MQTPNVTDILQEFSLNRVAAGGNSLDDATRTKIEGDVLRTLAYIAGKPDLRQRYEDLHASGGAPGAIKQYAEIVISRQERGQPPLRENDPTLKDLLTPAIARSAPVTPPPTKPTPSAGLLKDLLRDPDLRRIFFDEIKRTAESTSGVGKKPAELLHKMATSERIGQNGVIELLDRNALLEDDRSAHRATTIADSKDNIKGFLNTLSKEQRSVLNKFVDDRYLVVKAVSPKITRDIFLRGLLIGGVATALGARSYGKQTEAVHLQKKAAALPLEKQKTGPNGRDDDFFNTPVLADTPPSAEAQQMLADAKTKQQESVPYAVGAFALGILAVRDGVRATVGWNREAFRQKVGEMLRSMDPVLDKAAEHVQREASARSTA